MELIRQNVGIDIGKDTFVATSGESKCRWIFKASFFRFSHKAAIGIIIGIIS